MGEKMNVPFVDLRRQYLSIKKEIDEAIHQVLNRGQFILGKEVKAFEKEFADYCQTKFAIGVGSGTEALHLALKVCDIDSGDEVITTANTFIASALAISWVGAKPVFVDINPQTYNIDPVKIEEKITKKTKAILVVHLFGQAADMDSILALAKKYSFRVIEDACQAHGSMYKGKKAGSFGDLGCFSFYPSKNLGSYGDGGMIVTNNAEIAEKLRLLRNYGQTKKYHHQIKGYNTRLDEIQAAILRVKLKHLDSWNKKRRKHAQLYNELLTNPPIVTPYVAEDFQHNYYLYVIRTEKRNLLQKALTKAGISTLIHYPVPIHLQPAYVDSKYKKEDLLITEKYAKKILSLPMFPELKKSEMEYIVNCIKEFFKTASSK